MARPGLFTHRKLPRLARLAGVRQAEALGLLEFLWHAQYEACSEVVGDSLDVETLARWEGEKGVLVLALVDSGFVDANPDGTFSVHDFWDHAPDYVRKRAEREVDRKKRGVTLSEIRAESGRLGAKATNACRPEIGKHPAISRTVAGQCPASVRQIAVTPAPAPAPAPAPREEEPRDGRGRGEEAPPTASPPALPRRPHPAALLETWNRERGTLAAAKGISSGRERKARQRLNEAPDLERWASAFRRAAASPFCRGENDRGWRASLDWFLAPDTLLKVEEGKYDAATPADPDAGRRADDAERRRKRDLELQNQAREEARRIRAGLPMREEAPHA